MGRKHFGSKSGEDFKRWFVIEKLHLLGITHTLCGKHLHSCDYPTLKWLLALHLAKNEGEI